MSGEVLVDTNIVIAVFAGEPEVLARLDKVGRVLVPSIVLGELYYGAQKSQKVEDNTARIREFALSTHVLPVDSDTAQQYGRVKDQLRAVGRAIPENDIWIAALALQHGLPLISRDEHFNRVADINLHHW